MKQGGGQDKQGFAMKQGVLTQDRVKLMMSKGVQGCRGYGMRKGERYRKGVRGCIISRHISVLHLVIVKKGPAEIPGLTDESIPRRLGPKRASKIRKLFALTKDDDVRKYVIRRKFTKKNGKEVTKAPKIQRLITPIMLQRKRDMKRKKMAQIEKVKADAAAYHQVKTQHMAATRASRRSIVSKRRSSRRSKTEAKA